MEESEAFDGAEAYFLFRINLGLVPFSICSKMFMIGSIGVAQTSRFMFYLLSSHN